MSAGGFSTVRYQRDNLTAIHPIRVEKDSITTWNTAPAGEPTSDISAMVSRSQRSLGLHARTVTLRFPETNPPAGYKPGGITRIPVLTVAAFAALPIKGGTLQYLGVACTVVSKKAEKAN